MKPIMVALYRLSSPIGRRPSSSQRQRNARSQKPNSVSASGDEADVVAPGAARPTPRPGARPASRSHTQTAEMRDADGELERAAHARSPAPACRARCARARGAATPARARGPGSPARGATSSPTGRAASRSRTRGRRRTPVELSNSMPSACVMKRSSGVQKPSTRDHDGRDHPQQRVLLGRAAGGARDRARAARAPPRRGRR